MYFFTILEKMLLRDEKDVELNKKIENKVNSTSEKNHIKKQDVKKNTTTTKKDSDSVFCLFSATGDSVFVNNNGERITINLNEINHPNKYSEKSKEANSFINEKCKGKKLYLNIISNVQGITIADVFLDPEKTISLNKMLIENSLDKSTASVVNNSNMTEKEIKTVKDSVNKQEVKKDNNQIIGNLIDFGKAPYLNNPENKSSYFITIEKDKIKTMKWGVDLERAIKESKAKKNDYIKLNKGDFKPVANSSYSKASWKIEILEDINTTYKDIPGPPLEEIPIEPIDYNSFMEKDSTYDLEDLDNQYAYESNVFPEHEDMNDLDSILSDLNTNEKNIKIKI